MEINYKLRRLDAGAKSSFGKLVPKAMINDAVLPVYFQDKSSFVFRSFNIF